MNVRPLSSYAATALLALTASLTAVNWYLRPERALVWLTVVVLLVCMTAVLVRAVVGLRGSVARRDAASGSIVLASAILSCSLAAALASAVGAVEGRELAQRATMVLLAVALMAAGNTLPKRLTPLAGMRCDPARAQAFHRLAGWTWVLAGLALTIIWLVVPIDLARLASVLPLTAVMSVVLAHVLRLPRTA